ncbi:hypothetical protein Syun_031428 [Stephania yunnanensis]|uniref:Berberine/berberine-like domain-containing protein n=1 Tax=Stephania yunnanensis TaxID=152371 RepID=A0AAP0HG46_9MAGN
MSLAVMKQGWRTTRLEGKCSDSGYLTTTPPRCRSEVEEDRRQHRRVGDGKDEAGERRHNSGIAAASGVAEDSICVPNYSGVAGGPGRRAQSGERRQRTSAERRATDAQRQQRMHKTDRDADLMNLNRVEIDLKSETAWVESGATLGEIYYAISQASDELGFSRLSSPLRAQVEAMLRIEQVYPELEIPANEYHEVSWIESFTRLAGLDSVAQMKDRFLKYDDRGFKAKIDLLKSPLSLKAITGVLERLLKEPRGFVVVNGFNGMMGRISREESPFPHRKGTLMMVEYIVAWNMDEDLESHKFLSWLNELYEYVGQFIIDDKPRVSYVNHIDFDHGEIDWRNESSASNAIEISRKWGEKYFLSNYDRLVRAKTKIDPNNVFHHPQSIPPLLGIIENNIDDL